MLGLTLVLTLGTQERAVDSCNTNISGTCCDPFIDRSFAGKVMRVWLRMISAMGHRVPGNYTRRLCVRLFNGITIGISRMGVSGPSMDDREPSLGNSMV